MLEITAPFYQACNLPKLAFTTNFGWQCEWMSKWIYVQEDA